MKTIIYPIEKKDKLLAYSSHLFSYRLLYNNTYIAPWVTPQQTAPARAKRA